MSSSGAFNNPIIPGFNPDPSICRVNDDYFLVTSTFEYYPGIPVYHSKDLLKWDLIGHVITRHSQINMRTTEPSGGLWAPSIRYHEGKFYVSLGCTHRFRPKEWVSSSRGSGLVQEKKIDKLTLGRILSSLVVSM
jgi:beta-xylosidase